MTLADLIRNGDLDDYQPGYHRRAAALLPAEDIDREICATANCESCGHQGLDYRPFHSIDNTSYRAFACCPACKTASEF